MELLIEEFILVQGTYKKLEVGDLIFVRRSNFLARLFGISNRKKYKHVAVYIGNGRVLEVQSHRQVGYQNLSYYNGKYDVFRYNAPLTDFQKMRILFSLRSHIDLPYDRMERFIRLVRELVKFKIPWHETHRYICSEIIRNAYGFAGLSMPDGNICPDDLSMWSSFHQIS